MPKIEVGVEAHLETVRGRRNQGGWGMHDQGEIGDEI
jgi:hypothetical protein